MTLSSQHEYPFEPAASTIVPISGLQPTAEEKAEIVSHLPRHLLSPPDDEEIDMLLEEMLKLCERIDRMANQVLMGRPDHSTVLHNAVHHLKVDTSSIRWYISQGHAKGS